MPNLHLLDPRGRPVATSMGFNRRRNISNPHLFHPRLLCSVVDYASPLQLADGLVHRLA